MSYQRFGETFARNGREIYLTGEGYPHLLNGKIPLVAFVGTRAPTLYGKMICDTWGRVFASRGFGVITGAATGIDITASKVFAKEKSPVIEVLPAPLFRMDELSTYRDLKKIETMTEYAYVSQFTNAEESIQKYMFVKRNETIAMFADVIIVVEASGVSGSFHAVRHANKLGVPVYAVPGRIGEAVSLGCNLLIWKGDAKLALDPEIIINTVQERRGELLPRRRHERL